MLKYLYLSVACTMLTPTCFAGPTEVAPPPPHGKHDAHRGIEDTVEEEGGSLQKASQRNYNGPVTSEKEIVHPPHGKHASHHEAEEGADTLPSTSRKNYKDPRSRKGIVDPPHGKHASHRISIEPTDEEHTTVSPAQPEKISRSKTRGRP